MSDPKELEFDPFLPRQKSGRASAVAAWLALLITLALVAWQGWQWWRSQAVVAAGAAGLQQLAGAQSSLQERLANLEAGLAAAPDQSTALSQLQVQLTALAQAAEQDRMVAGNLAESLLQEQQQRARLEQQLAELAAQEDAGGREAELDEAAWLLKVASERLQLFQDPRMALGALQLADEILAGLEDPHYLPVRQDIAVANTALRALPAPDNIALAGELARLQAAAAALPLKSPAAAAPAEADSAYPAEPSAWASLSEALSGLVTIRRRVPEDALLALDEQAFVRQGLWLQWEAARLALARLDQAGWTQALQQTASTLDAYFEAEASAVKAVRDANTLLLAEPIAASAPDISQPWTRLHELRGRRVQLNSEPPAAAQ